METTARIEGDERARLLESNNEDDDNLLHRPPTSIELRLATFAFFCLCMASIGFGLFAGELSQVKRSEKDDHHEVVIVTKTVTVPAGVPTGVPSPPSKPHHICSSGPCVDAAGELRRTIDWSVDPCVDFAGFQAIHSRPPSTEIISSEINQSIHQLILTPSQNPILQKIRKFHTICLVGQNSTRLDSVIPIIKIVSNLWNDSKLSRSIRLSSCLAYLHSYLIPSLFSTSIINQDLLIRPSKNFDLKDIEDSFRLIYPSKDLTRRIQQVKKLQDELTGLIKNKESVSKLVSIQNLQNIVCAHPWLSCPIDWQDYYSALSSKIFVDKVYVEQLGYFGELARVLEEHSDESIESYFHWTIISTITEKTDCLREVRLRFGPSLIKNLFVTSEQQKNDWKGYLNSTQYVIKAIQDTSFTTQRSIVSPSLEQSQTDELWSIDEDSWFKTILNLNRLQSLKLFENRILPWDVLGTDIEIWGDQIYLPMGILHKPLVYSFSSDLPRAILFGSFGFLLTEQLSQSSSFWNSNAVNQSSCKLSLSKAFKSWKDDDASNSSSHDSNSIKLIGLDHLKSQDSIFFLAFGRLGSDCQSISDLKAFRDAFNCS